MLSTRSGGGSAGELVDSALLHAGTDANAAAVSVRDSISTLLITLAVPNNDRRSGVTRTLPSTTSSVVPTLMPSIVTCGNGSAPNLMLFTDTGAFSLTEASFSICGM